MTATPHASSRRPTMAAVLTSAAEMPGNALDRALAAVEPLQLLTPKEAAAILAVTPRTLERWRMTGEGPRFLKLSRATVRYTAADLAAFQVVCLRRNTA